MIKNTPYAALLTAFLHFLLGGLSCAITFGLFVADAKFFPGLFLNEFGLTELSQAGLLLSSSALFMLIAARKNHPGCHLIAGFLLCMFLRELDLFFDETLGHGTWVYFALAAAAVFIFLGFRGGIRRAFEDLSLQTACRSFCWLLAGMVTVLIFSRLFGMKSFWYLTLPNVDITRMKRITEECLELWGYVQIFFAAVGFTRIHFFSGKNSR